MKYGLPDSTINAIQRVLAAYPDICEVIIYGSRAKGNYREGSDIDLTIKGHNLDYQKLNQIELALDDLMLPYKIDLSIYQKLTNVSLLEHIDRVGMVFFEPHAQKPIL